MAQAEELDKERRREKEGGGEETRNRFQDLIDDFTSHP